MTHLFEQRLRGWLSPLIYLSTNWVSRLGVIGVTTGGVLWLVLLPSFLRGDAGHPYLGILMFLGLPGVFFGGLILIPLGMLMERRRRRRRGEPPPTLPVLEWRSPEIRRLVVFIGVTTLANLVIGAQLLYRATDYMDSVTFCGRTCHKVMAPEYTAYQASPHARVACVACHIGPGASWFVRSKLSGVGQVFATLLNTYPRPIPTPIANLRPARETCEQCHWPQKFGADRLRVVQKFADDEANSRTFTVLLMHIGGGHQRRGIHGAHLDPGVTIEYAHVDRGRQNIPWVRYTNAATGRSTTYMAADATPETVRALPRRLMDCMDCHNRPTHIFELPEAAVDHALASGAISPGLPGIKKLALELLKKDYPSQEAAAAAIPAMLERHYRQRPGFDLRNRDEVLRAGRAIAEIYTRNVFPRMKVGWGTYPNNIGHMDFPGCFRCHDDRTSTDGRKITQDCNTCHRILAMDEAAPAILSELGLAQANSR